MKRLHTLLAIFSVFVCLQGLPLHAAESWCSDGTIVEAIKSLTGGEKTTPDILVLTTPWPGCESIDATKIGSGEPTTCSIQAALDHVTNLDPPGSATDAVLLGVAGGMSNAMAHESLNISHEGTYELIIAGCGVRVRSLSPDQPAVKIIKNRGPVAVLGMHFEAEASAAILLDESLAPVQLRHVRVSDSEKAIQVENAAAPISIYDSTISDISGVAVGAMLTTGLRLENVTLSNANAGIRAVKSAEHFYLHSCRFFDLNDSAVNVTTSSGHLEAAISKTSFTGGSGSSSHVLFTAAASSSLKLTFDQGTSFSSLRSQALQVNAGDGPQSSASVKISVLDSRFHDAAKDGLNGLVLTSSGESRLDFRIKKAVFQGICAPRATGGVITVQASGGVVEGVISETNIFGSEGQRGIAVFAEPVPEAQLKHLELTVQSCTIDDIVAREAVFVGVRKHAGNAAIRLFDNRIGLEHGVGGGANQAVEIRSRGKGPRTVWVLLHDNQVSGNTRSALVDIDAEDESTVNAVLENNSFNNFGVGPVLAIASENSSSNVCLHLDNTRTVNGTGQIEIVREAGVFSVVDLARIHTKNTAKISISSGVASQQGPCGD
jgi:hypothetical protein